MKFDWKDAAILLAVFISMNVMSGYVHGNLNPMSWPQTDRALVALLYACFGGFPLALRRMP